MQARQSLHAGALVLALAACGGDAASLGGGPSDTAATLDGSVADARAPEPQRADASPSSGGGDAGPVDAASVWPSDAAADAGAPLDDAIRHYELDWLDGTVDSGFVTHATIEIDASVERVWQLVRDVNGYGRWCSVLSADAGSVAPGEPIHLAIELGDPGAAPTESDEIIGVVDDARRAISWSRDFGFEQKTLRFQIVTPSPIGARYTTALRYPAELGSLVIPLLGPNLDRAFQTIAEDLARAAQSP
jgi:Polyketide cyclase / dehydrase and lipid transport